MTHRRGGSILLELSLAVLLLAVALVAVAHLVALAARQDREMRSRAAAIREVANVTEHVMALSWEATTAEQVAAVTLDPSARALLPDAALTIDVDQVRQPRQAKRIGVSLQYRNTAGMQVEPLTLVAWKFSPEGVE